MSREIFVNYRRGDMPGFAGRLFDRIEDAFGQGAVFMDVDGIDPGLDFVDVLNEQLASCKVLVAIVGPEWAHAKDASGRRRLDDPNDFVRLEIATALERGIRVIPVLVGGADVLRTEDLPTDLHPLARRQAVVVSHERFAQDIQPLMGALQRVVGAAAPAGAQAAIPQGASPVAEVLERFRGAANLYIGTAIPPQRLANARKKARIPADLPVHGLFDFTVFGNANDSMALTDQGIYYHHSIATAGQELIHLPLSALKAAPAVKAGLQSIAVGTVTFRIDGGAKLEQVVDLFNAIREKL